MRGNEKARFLVQSAMVAAIYTVLTYLASMMNLAYGTVQFRFSEALTILPVLTPAAIPGLTLGCFLSNLASPLGPVDWVFGSLATLLAAVCSYGTRNMKVKGLPVVSAVFPVLFNAVIIGLENVWLASGEGEAAWAAFLPIAVSVGGGELVVCFALGLPLYYAIEKSGASKKIFQIT